MHILSTYVVHIMYLLRVTIFMHGFRFVLNIPFHKTFDLNTWLKYLLY